MKNIFVLIGMILVMIPLTIFMIDFNNVDTYLQAEKREAETAINGASMMYDLESYGEGILVFSDRDILGLLEDTLAEKYCYTLYIYDEYTRGTGSKPFYTRTYQNYTVSIVGETTVTTKITDMNQIYSTGIAGARAFTFTSTQTDKNGYAYQVTQPCLVLVLDRLDEDGDFYENDRITVTSLTRATMYTVDTRNLTDIYE